MTGTLALRGIEGHMSFTHPLTCFLSVTDTDDDTPRAKKVASRVGHLSALTRRCSEWEKSVMCHQNEWRHEMLGL